MVTRSEAIEKAAALLAGHPMTYLGREVDALRAALALPVETDTRSERERARDEAMIVEVENAGLRAGYWTDAQKRAEDIAQALAASNATQGGSDAVR